MTTIAVILAFNVVCESLALVEALQPSAGPRGLLITKTLKPELMTVHKNGSTLDDEDRKRDRPQDVKIL